LNSNICCLDIASEKRSVDSIVKFIFQSLYTSRSRVAFPHCTDLLLSAIVDTMQIDCRMHLAQWTLRFHSFSFSFVLTGSRLRQLQSAKISSTYLIHNLFLFTNFSTFLLVFSSVKKRNVLIRSNWNNNHLKNTTHSTFILRN
jgi:hypothetical protein